MVTKRHAIPDEWSETIIAFESPYKLRELSIPQEEPREIRESAVEQQKFKIRLANTEERRDSASLLIQKRYSWRGYETGEALEKTPNKITLLAFNGEQIAGTLTLGLDSADGLLVDDLYKPEIDVLRASGRKVCELTKLAVDESVKSKMVLAALFHIAFIYGHNIHKGTDFVIEINPRHTLFYKRMLGFNHFGPERHCERVSAPAVLLRLELEYAKAEIARLGGLGKDAVNVKSLYPYFFTMQDDLGITARLNRGE